MAISEPRNLSEVWEKDCKVEAHFEDSQSGATVTIAANEEGLISLAKLFLFIARAEDEKNYHVHFDIYSGLEPTSNVGLIIQKVSFEEERRKEDN